MNTHVNIKLPLGLAASLLFSSGLSANDPHDVFKDDHTGTYAAHKAAEHQAIEARITSLKGADIYACNLVAHGNQCREYAIPKTEQHKLQDLKSSCESLPNANLHLGSCPQSARVGVCQHIVRNHHDPQSLIYRNIYYSGAQSPWNQSEIARVCEDLEGELVMGENSQANTGHNH